MPVAITIRNVPDEVRNELAARAARSGRSLQEYLCHELTVLATLPSTDLAIESARGELRSGGSTVTTADILTAIEADRR